MFHHRDDTMALAPSPVKVGAPPSGRCAGDDMDGLLASGAQFDWDLDTQQIAVFARNRQGIDANEPAAVCSFDAWLASVVSSDRRKVGEKMASLVAGTARSFEAQFRVEIADGRAQWVDLCGVVVRDQQQRPSRIIWQQSPLSSADMRQPWHQPSAFHDPLTGLPNRWLFDRALAEAASAAGSRFAVLFIDLDGFKTVNDRYGHLVGDRALVAVSLRLAHCVRPGDLLARRGGDEFTVLLRDIAGNDDALAVAHRIVQQVRAPISLDRLRLEISASIGIALSGGEPATVDALLAAADAAMYRAKHLGGDRPAMSGVFSRTA